MIKYELDFPKASQAAGTRPHTDGHSLAGSHTPSTENGQKPQKFPIEFDQNGQKKKKKKARN